MNEFQILSRWQKLQKDGGEMGFTVNIGRDLNQPKIILKSDDLTTFADTLDEAIGCLRGVARERRRMERCEEQVG